MVWVSWLWHYNVKRFLGDSDVDFLVFFWSFFIFSIDIRIIYRPKSKKMKCDISFVHTISPIWRIFNRICAVQYMTKGCCFYFCHSLSICLAKTLSRKHLEPCLIFHQHPNFALVCHIIAKIVQWSFMSTLGQNVLIKVSGLWIMEGTLIVQQTDMKSIDC